MKVALSEIKKNPQRNNSGGDEVENQSNDLEHKEGESIQSEQQEEKRISKNEDRLWNLLEMYRHLNYRGARRRRGRARN